MSKNSIIKIVHTQTGLPAYILHRPLILASPITVITTKTFFGRFQSKMRNLYCSNTLRLGDISDCGTLKWAIMEGLDDYNEDIFFGKTLLIQKDYPSPDAIINLDELADAVLYEIMRQNEVEALIDDYRLAVECELYFESIPLIPDLLAGSLHTGEYDELLHDYNEIINCSDDKLPLFINSAFSAIKNYASQRLAELVQNSVAETIS